METTSFDLCLRLRRLVIRALKFVRRQTVRSLAHRAPSGLPVWIQHHLSSHDYHSHP